MVAAAIVRASMKTGSLMVGAASSGCGTFLS